MAGDQAAAVRRPAGGGRVLGRLAVPHFLPLYASVGEALDQAASQPSSLQQRLWLAPTPAAPAAARRFVRETLRHWQLDPPDRELGELAQLLADELVTNAVIHDHTDLGLRLELRGGLLHVAVRDSGRRLLRPVPDDAKGEGAAACYWSTSSPPPGAWTSILGRQGRVVHPAATGRR